MSLSNYNELKTSVADHLHRADLTTVIPDLVKLGEARLNRRLRLRSMIDDTTITPSQVNRYVSLPTGYIETIAFVNDYGEDLQEVSYEELKDIGYGISGRRPRYYSITDRIDFECVADSSYSLDMRYYKRLDIETDTTNDVLTNHPDLYLYSALLAAEPYLKNDKRVTVWAELLNTSINEANQRDTRNDRRLRTEIGGNRQFNILRGYT